MLWSSAKGFESWQSYVNLKFFLWQDCRLLNGSIYNHLFSLMLNFAIDNSLRISQSNQYTLLEVGLTCTGGTASWTRSAACPCLCGEIGVLYPSKLGQQPALFHILSHFWEVLPDCQCLHNLLADHCLLVNNQVCSDVSDILFCLKWWTLPGL